MKSDDMLKQQRFYSKDWAERGRPDVIVWDVLPIAKVQAVRLTLISQNSPHWQGVDLGINPAKGGVEVWGEYAPRGAIVIWEPGTPEEIICKCTSNKGFLRISNIHVDPHNWKGHPQLYTRSYGCGMLLEEKGNLLIYHCNDWGFDTNFDKLVFSVEKLPCS
ncbi:MAG: hypothetical protein M1319_00375 [Chloroflexi bacterium]|nr:hypothetical protein [Chloroflexota bacterium]